MGVVCRIDRLKPVTHRIIPKVICMANDKKSKTASNPTQCVAATASEAREYSPAPLKVDKPQKNPTDPVDINYAKRFLP
jgi:hypothetical protein